MVVTVMASLMVVGGGGCVAGFKVVGGGGVWFVLAFSSALPKN